MIERGTGAPIVLVPGVQGRWEWMEPAVDALAHRCRVITASLPAEPPRPQGADAARGFDAFVDWVDALLDTAGLSEATICGVSYGGLIALRYAAVRPTRVTRLVLVSTPAPTWRPSRQASWYLRAPYLLSPAFALSSPFRLYPEIARALPGLVARGTFSLRHLYRVTRHPFSPGAMAVRVRLLTGVDFSTDCTRVAAPTLVVTGTPGLDRVVDVSGTRQYASRIPGSTLVEIPDTGHIGLITRPERFAASVVEFVTHQPDARPEGVEVLT